MIGRLGVFLLLLSLMPYGRMAYGQPQAPRKVIPQPVLPVPPQPAVPNPQAQQPKSLFPPQLYNADGLSPDEAINVAVYESCNRSVVNISTVGLRADRFFMMAVPEEGSGSGSVESVHSFTPLTSRISAFPTHSPDTPTTSQRTVQSLLICVRSLRYARFDLTSVRFR